MAIFEVCWVDAKRLAVFRLGGDGVGRGTAYLVLDVGFDAARFVGKAREDFIACRERLFGFGKQGGELVVFVSW